MASDQPPFALTLKALWDFHEQEEREGRCPSCGRFPDEKAAWALCGNFHTVVPNTGDEQ